MPDLKNVSAGDRLNIPADRHNAWNFAAKWARNQQHRNRHAPHETAQSGIILVQNNSGFDVARFGVLGITQPIILPDDNEDEFMNRVMFSCDDEPSPELHTGKFVIALEPLAAVGSGTLPNIGRAVISGVVQALVEVAHVNDKYVDVRSEDPSSGCRLRSFPGHGSGQLLWTPNTTGIQWGVIRIGPMCRGPMTVTPTSLTSRGGGMYTGRIWNNPGTINPTDTDLTADLLGSDPGEDNCVIMNKDEIDQDTHDLLLSPRVVTHFTGHWAQTLVTDFPVIEIGGSDWENCEEES